MVFLKSLLAPALVGSMVLGPMLFVLGVLILWKRFVRNRNRRSPLTSDLLRTPGYGLQDRIEEMTHEVSGYLLGIILIPLVFFGIYRLQVDYGSVQDSLIVGVIYLLAVLAALPYLIVKLVRRADERQKYREALAGELATAQLLEPVIAGGGRVLHDIQAQGFNIDHVVVAPGGVFAVETKHRLKSTKGKAIEQARVSFDGKALHFPDWVETKPAAQARWLSERLTRSTGLVVQARPVIALPGWYVTQTAQSDVSAINPKNCGFMLKPRRAEPSLPKESIQRIAFQVEQVCRMPNPGERAQKDESG